MFALESLSLVGKTYETSESARRACDFLVSKQRSLQTVGGARATRYVTRYVSLDVPEHWSGIDVRGLCVDRA